MIKHPLFLLTCCIVFAACRQRAKTDTPAGDEDSSLMAVTDSSRIAPGPDTSFIQPDTVSYRPEQLLGKWLQPVPGLDKEKQGFDLRKDSVARSINMYTLVYEKWALVKDTLLLWNHTEGVHDKDSAATIDTTIIKTLTDSTLVLFPVKAAEGYLEQYEKDIKKRKK
ncbi:lipocalin family protein [Chitinophaga agrisoli]|uniref:Lipocalin family protein n=1 Tax=Chitinophaga agrisoli TaxID=2607653 RepID=A0A5B2VZP3_9BACT|nr:lipocalin family protein [Chitinophaga agrisoli]KAA2244881.1 lipocalin family protein [Chitinophaga agrisoli]